MHVVQSAMRHGFILIVFSLFLLQPLASAEEVQLPDNLKPAMEHLLALVGNDAESSVDQGIAGTLIDFVAAPKDMREVYTMGRSKGAVSNYYEFRIDRSFSEVIDLNYHPDIPSYITNPASVRHSRWIEIDGKEQPLPRLANAWATLSPPLVIKGVEYVENTPDTFSGAYYAYYQDRTLVLMNHKGRRILISISRQRDKSTVGKKGLVLGADDNWEYLYTGEKGCTRPGMGWVKSYMYRAESIFVYYETDDPSPGVKCGVFKWLNAGWAGINMVQPVHIRNGLQRFSTTFKSVLESPRLKVTPQFVDAFRQIENLSTETLRQRVRHQLAGLRSKHEDSSRRNKKWFKQLFADDGYLKTMEHEELKALVIKAYLKFLLGKNKGFDISALKTQKQPG